MHLSLKQNLLHIENLITTLDLTKKNFVCEKEKNKYKPQLITTGKNRLSLEVKKNFKLSINKNGNFFDEPNSNLDKNFSSQKHWVLF